MIDKIHDGNRLLALIIPAGHTGDGAEFFTPPEFSQQLGYMKHTKGYRIQPHIHRPFAREIQYTKEVLFIRSGKVRVDFYDDAKNFLESRVLRTGDVILLAFGGHGFEMLEESEIIEAKQGPYAEENDKERFEAVRREG